MRKEGIFLITFILALLLVSGANAQEQTYPINVTDYFNTTVTIEDEPQRILSLSPSNTEILFAVGAGEDVIGATKFSDYPPEVKDLPNVGGFHNINIEKVVGLNPDLIFAQVGNSEETINRLRELGFTVIVMESKTVDDILDNIHLVGKATDNIEKARSITDNMSEQVEAIKSQTHDIPDDKRPKVLYVIWHDPMYAAGVNTFPGHLIEIAGGKNILDSEGWPIVNAEDVVSKNPDIIICSNMKSGSEKLAQNIRDNQIFAQTDALEQNNVYSVEKPSTIERPGPRIVQGLKLIHEYTSSEISSFDDSTSRQSGNADYESSQNKNSDTSNNPQTPGFGILTAIGTIMIIFLTRKRY